MKERVFDTKVQLLKYKALKAVIERAYAGTLEQALYEIPKEIVPGPKSDMRCCIYKERAVLSERVRMAMGGDKNNPKSVDYHLNDHAANGDNRILKGHGKPQTNQANGQSPIHAKIASVQREDINAPNVIIAVHAGNHLSDQGGNGRASNSPSETVHKQYV